MRLSRWVTSAALVIVLGITGSASAAPITIGQIDTFDSGTTEGWMINLLGMGGPQVVPLNFPTGGPSGAGDNFLLMASSGLQGPASRMTVLNASQWAGDYIAGGVTAIAMDVFNLGSTVLDLRLLFEDAMGGPPQNVAASTNSIVVPAFSGWMHVVFPINPGSLTALSGTVNAALSNATILRIFDNAALGFPGPPKSGLLGIDNITAVAEPATFALLAFGIAAVARRTRRPRR